VVNFNGNITSEKEASLNINNRGFMYGDALFETIKVVRKHVLFLEDHYFRLMSSMRILRMDIPMNFTMEFMEKEILDLLEKNGLDHQAARVKFMVYRNEGGHYRPKSNDVGYLVLTEKLNDDFYVFNEEDYILEIYKDHYISPGLMGNLKTNNRIINVIGSIYARENAYHNCLVLNTDKAVVEALNANIFLVRDTVIKTPPLLDGCIKGVIRKQIIDIIRFMPELTLLEESIYPFDLRKADELFVTNSIIGIQPVTQYRKKTFGKDVSTRLLAKLNVRARSN
jgi:branched-chain amino acid aminotransferase